MLVEFSSGGELTILGFMIDAARKEYENQRGRLVWMN